MHQSFTPASVTVDQIAKLIDHSLLRPELTKRDVREGCELAAHHRVASVCVRPCDVDRAARHLSGTDVLVGTVVAFPHGDALTEIKAAETTAAVKRGAHEIDMVLNIGRLRSGDLGFVEADIRAVVEAAEGVAVKVILETAYLSDVEKIAGCQAAERAGAAFVKTSTGFAPSGATIADLKLMRAAVSPGIGVKAAGGVRDLDTLLEMANVGVNRFGASATQAILHDLASRQAAA